MFSMTKKSISFRIVFPNEESFYSLEVEEKGENYIQEEETEEEAGEEEGETSTYDFFMLVGVESSRP